MVEKIERVNLREHLLFAEVPKYAKKSAGRPRDPVRIVASMWRPHVELDRVGTRHHGQPNAEMQIDR